MLEAATGTEKIELAKIVARIMTNCCDVPQSTSGCGCSGGGDDPILLE